MPARREGSARLIQEAISGRSELILIDEHATVRLSHRKLAISFHAGASAPKDERPATVPTATPGGAR